MSQTKDLSKILNPALSEPVAANRSSSGAGGGASAQDVEGILLAEHADPFRFLGPHSMEASGQEQLVVRAFLPRANEVSIVFEDGRGPFPAERIHPEGLFEAVIPGANLARLTPSSYRLRVREADGSTQEIHDPYAFPALLTDFDLHLIGEGTHYLKYEKLGAHVREVSGIRGVHFGVWAPNARRVSVVGDFNQWDGRAHPMRHRGSSGVWEFFLPGIEEGAIYKFEIRSNSGDAPFLKADPYAFYSELRPKSGSRVANLDRYTWGDAEWMGTRQRKNWLEEPMAIYEVHLGSWRRVPEEGNRWLTYRELADQLIPYVQGMGFTHIELLPVMEHPLDRSWGYQTIGYYAATSRYGTPGDLMYFIDCCHQAGIGVLLDWTPAHFPRDAHGLAEFDGTHLYEHADPRQGAHPDWGTLVFNYARNEVQNFLLSNALFWIEKYHLDGLRVDAVASMLYLDYSRRPGEWIPNEYGGRENLAAIALIKRLNEVVHGRHRGVLTIAEESTAWPAVSRPTYLGGLGFSLKWNMGWMNDTLSYFRHDPVHRKYHHNNMTFSMLYAFTENFVLPLSHDEVVHGKASLLNKMPGDLWQQFANLRLLFGYLYGHPGKKLLFMGGEFGQREEWHSETSLEWHLLQYEEHQGLTRLVADLNRLYAAEPALHEVDFDWQGFEWIDCHDGDSSVLSLIRRAKRPEDFVVVVANFTPVAREGYRVGVPEPGFYAELLNTDGAAYGGSNWGNFGGQEARPEPHLGRPYSLNLRLPPLGTLFLKLLRG
ncbi:MAG TPA: 1,4-alpha-glucan branching protein GlgB [Candidatus Acidoferrales bacterium]|nr:1,4-alpha-glucan branching protein GlgB [Candidatus Acidoferrales bacterium]